MHDSNGPNSKTGLSFPPFCSARTESAGQGRMGKEGETFCVKLLEFHHVTLCCLGVFSPHVREKGKDSDRLKSLTCPVG